MRKRRPITEKDRELVPTPEQRKFVEEYLKCQSAVKAYTSVFGPPSDPELAGKLANKLLKAGPVRVLLHDYDTKVAKRTEKILDKYAATKETILEELAKIAFTRTTDLLEYGENGVIVKPSSEIGEAAAAISEVSEYETKEGGKRIRVKTYDRQAALVNLGKALGMFQEQVKHDHEHKHVTFIINKD